jgi:hypothetical protein
MVFKRRLSFLEPFWEHLASQKVIKRGGQENSTGKKTHGISS